jgi:hypothetical protein
MTKIIFALALFMTGEMLSIPFAAFLALPLIALMKPLTSSRVMERILAVAFIPCAAVTAAAVSIRLAALTGHMSLPQTPVWLIAAVVVLIAFYLAYGGQDGIGKFSVFALPLTLGYIALSAILLAGKLQQAGIFVPRVWEQSPLFLACEGITLLGLMPALKYKEKPFRAYLLGFAIACGIGAAVWALSNFTLGAELFERARFPFYTALRVAKGGELIGRIEAFLLPVALCAAILKTAVCMTVVTHGFKAYLPPGRTVASKTSLPSAKPEM